MINKLSLRFAGTVLIAIPTLLIIFHICVFFGLVPQDIVWTGRITSESSILIMAFVSIFLNLVLIFCAVVQMGYLKNPKSILIVEKILPFVFYWLIGNTIANLFSKSSFELFVFTPILIILTVCFYRIKIHKIMG